MSEQTVFEKFLLWENAGREIVSTKKAYIDMSGGDLVAGVVISEIIFWHLPNKDGQSKLRVQHDNKLWIAIRRTEWWDRCRVTERQADKALKMFADCGIIEKKVYKFKGEPTVHVRVVEEVFLKAWNNATIVPLENPILHAREKASISLPSENEITTQLPEFTTLSNPLTDLTTPVTTDSLKISANAQPKMQKPPKEEKPKTAKATDFPELVLYRSVTELWPAKACWNGVLRKMHDISVRLGRQPTKDDLMPYFEAWCGNGWSKVDVFNWLDYAVRGEIPKKGNQYGANRQVPTQTQQYTDADRKLGAELRAKRENAMSGVQ